MAPDTPVAGPPPGSRRRVLAALLAGSAVVATAAVLVALGLWARSVPTPVGSSVSPAGETVGAARVVEGPDDVVETDARLTALGELLDRRAAALLARDRQALRATQDASSEEGARPPAADDPDRAFAMTIAAAGTGRLPDPVGDRRRPRRGAGGAGRPGGR